MLMMSYSSQQQKSFASEVKELSSTEITYQDDTPQTKESKVGQIVSVNLQTVCQIIENIVISIVNNNNNNPIISMHLKRATSS